MVSARAVRWGGGTDHPPGECLLIPGKHLLPPALGLEHPHPDSGGGSLCLSLSKSELTCQSVTFSSYKFILGT